MTPKTDYAHLDEATKAEIVKQFDYARGIGATDPMHAVAIAADAAFHLTNKQLNGEVGIRAFASALAVCAMRGKISMTWKD